MKHDYEDVLNEDVKRSGIEELSDKGFLETPARTEALVYWNRSRNWGLWLDRLLLFLGSGFILAAIVFFFAFNWAKLAPFYKFALVEVGILACILATFKMGPDTIGGKVFLLSAAVLVGVFLAVFGQVYQTGADAYELFTGWAMLIIGWVLLSKFSALWVMWLVVINTGLALYWNQVLFPYETKGFFMLYLLLAAIDAAALILFEYGRQKKIDWLAAKWPRFLLLATISFLLSVPSIEFILEGTRSKATVWPLLVLAVFLAAGYWYFRLKVPNLAALTLCALTFCVILLVAIGRLVLPHRGGAFIYLFFGIIILGVFSAASFWLKRTNDTIGKEKRRID